MSRRSSVPVLAILALAGLALAWLFLSGDGEGGNIASDGAAGGGAGDAEGEQGDGKIPSGGGAPEKPSLATLLRSVLGEDGDRAAREVLDRVGSPDELLRALAWLRTPKERAVALSRLVRVPDPAGLAFVRDAAEGKLSKEIRQPAILALAAAGPDGVDTLAAVGRSGTEPELAATAIYALCLSGTAEGHTAVAEILESAIAAPDRTRIYDAILGGVPGLAPGPELLTALSGGGRPAALVPNARFPAPYHRVVAAVSAERDPGLMPAASRVLAHLPTEDAAGGILLIWGRTEEGREQGEIRERVFDAVRNELPPRREAVLVRMAAAAIAPEATELRRRALETVRGRSAPGLRSALREWAAVETDPALRDELCEELRRMENLPEDEGR